MITRTLPPEAVSLEDAQTEIKRIIKNAYFAGKTFAQIKKDVDAVVSRAVQKITIETLKKDAAKSLYNLASRVYRQFVLQLGLSGVLAMKRICAARDGKTPAPRDSIVFNTVEKGVPAGIYSRDYMAQVKATLDSVADLNAIDPNDRRGRNSLRNLAEMETRYKAQQDSIAVLKAQGQRLVYCSAHADCSDRCFPWQGRVYSLDGSSGKTEDGQSYVPLERATDVYYTTKTGRVYKNGLLGFNCRHKLYAFVDGMALPRVSKAEQKKESAITQKQRALEGQIRHYRERALMYDGIDPRLAADARKRAVLTNKAYEKFSRQNERAFYPDRVKVL